MQFDVGVGFKRTGDDAKSVAGRAIRLEREQVKTGADDDDPGECFESDQTDVTGMIENSVPSEGENQGAEKKEFRAGSRGVD